MRLGVADLAVLSPWPFSRSRCPAIQLILIKIPLLGDRTSPLDKEETGAYRQSPDGSGGLGLESASETCVKGDQGRIIWQWSVDLC